MWRQITPSLCKQSQRHGYIMTKIMLQMPDDDGDVVSINKSDPEKLFIVFNAQCEYLKLEYASLVVKSNCNDETSRLFRSFKNNSAAFSDDSLRNVRIAVELAAVQNRFSPRLTKEQEGDVAEVHKVSKTVFNTASTREEIGSSPDEMKTVTRNSERPEASQRRRGLIA